MSFSKATILKTREAAYGDRWLGQVVSIPSGTIGKVSLYLEPELADDTLSSLIVTVRIYALDPSGLPTGLPIAVDTKTMADIKYRGLINFATQGACPTSVAIVISLSGGDTDNYIGWRYVSSASSTDSLLISLDAGSSWTKDPTRKFAYIAYSPISDAVTFDSTIKTASLTDVTDTASTDQTASILPGTPRSIVDDTEDEFNELDLTRAIVDGNSIVIKFGDFVVSLVIDNSGSMTWNDRSGTRFDFLKAYIDDMESIIPSSSEVLYSVYKFNSRKLGRMRVILQEDTSVNAVAGTRVIRKIGSIPVSSPVDGIVVYEGLGEQVLDGNLVSGNEYQYGVFAYDASGNFSEIRRGKATPISAPKPPMGVAAFLAQEEIVKNGDYDIGKRKINISWVHPATSDSSLAYEKIYLVRRDDRPPISPEDGTLLGTYTPLDAGYDGPYVDFDTPGFVQSNYPTAGLTYYYAMFTENADGTRCLVENARTSSVTVSEVERFWEKAPPPYDDPSLYGFDDTPPGIPTAITANVGDKQLQISWTAGSNATRYVVYFKPDNYPSLVGLSGGDTLGYDGTIVYDGSDVSFIHRGLENGEPNFYVVVSFDNVANMSTGVQFTEEAIADNANSIPPESVNSLAIEPYNSTTNLVSWKLPITDERSITGWFGDSIRAQCDITFQDTDTRTTLSTLEFVEETRTTVTMQDDGTTVTLTNNAGQTTPLTGDNAALAATAVDPYVGALFSNVPQDDSTSIISVFTAAPLLSIQSRMSQVSISFHALLSAKNRATGELITGTKTESVSITLKNPLGVSIVNEPQKIINRPKWTATCNADTSPELTYEQLPGVYVRTGESFPVHVDITFKDQNLGESIPIAYRVLDKTTGQPSPYLRTPDMNDIGIAIVQTIEDTDELLDRTGQPNGETETVTRAFIDLPPQDTPGDFTLEVTVFYKGYTRVITYDIHYEASLNIDVNAVPFLADGISSAEQSAFVYLGDPLGNSKIPVDDGVIVDWKITPLDSVSKKNLKKRPFYSRDNVAGTGIKSYTIGGTAKKVFFGPGTDIGPETVNDQTEQETSSCAPGGEVYELAATVKTLGMTRTGYAVIILQGPEPDAQLNRIFLRKVDGFNTDIIYADGITESAWEVLAKPEEDGTPTEEQSGAFFRDKITDLGGLVPQLPEGKVITLSTRLFEGTSEGESLIIRTNLTGTEGRPNYAKATVVNGKATFYLKLNTRVSGKIKQKPLPGEQNASNNIAYGSSDKISWEESPLIYSLTAYTSIEVQGLPVVFYGGGSNLEFHTPPCYLSFKEPLALGIDSDNEEV